MWESLFIGMLRKLFRRGTMVLYLPDGKMEQIGDNTGEPLTIRITDPSFARRFVFNPELAVGEAYMDGTFTVDGDDLHALTTLGLRNLSIGQGNGIEGLVSPMLRWLKQYNPIARSRVNVAHHYDLSGELFELFLDDDKQYSCGYFVTPADTLETAQKQKKAHIAAKLCLEPGMRVLDIGCGWGGMAMTLAQNFDVNVVGITLSEEQHKTACERVRTAGLEDRVDIRLMDYREIKTKFERIVSVGMFEHVGTPHYRKFFSHVRDNLTEDGVALIHTIGREAPPGRTSPWINKYIFPGCHVPSLSEIAPVLENEGLWITDLEVWRLHYAETLKHWHDRFTENIDAARELYDERFCRMWRYYLVASEQSFRFGRQVVFQVQLTKNPNVLPMTRDYILCPTTQKSVKTD